VKCRLIHVGWLLLVMAPVASAQLQAGDNVTMQMNGTLTGGYSGNYGNQIPSSHTLDFGADAQLTGDYYSPNFLNFTLSPYYDRSSANSASQSLTNSSGVDAAANLFSGSHFPGYVNYRYANNSTGIFGLAATPNFTTVGTNQAFGVGWSVLLPNRPTLSVSYAQGSGNGNVFGTDQESTSSTKTFNVRSSYTYAGWNLLAYFHHLNIDAKYPEFISGETGNNLNNSGGNDVGVAASHALPWQGSIAMNYSHYSYSSDYSSELADASNATNYSINLETANLIFRPTQKLSLFASQSFTTDINGFLYQNLIENNGGIPINQSSSQSFANTVSGGASYNFLPNFYSTAQITYYNEMYLGNTYDGSYFTGTVGYAKRLLRTFTFSATVIDTTNKFSNNSLGFIGNVNAFHAFGPWELSGNVSYAQNVQTILVTYTTSYFNYGANLHRKLNRGMQWTVAANGSRSGFTNQPDTLNHTEAFATSLAIRHVSLGANYGQASGQSLLTSSGIQPIPPTPGLPLGDLIVYNGRSYGATLTLTPLPRLMLSGSYAHANSSTLSDQISSLNRTEIYYAQLQYRLRRISLLAGFTKFSQGISAAGTPPGNEYSYFIGVSRWISFF